MMEKCDQVDGFRKAWMFFALEMLSKDFLMPSGLFRCEGFDEYILASSSGF